MADWQIYTGKLLVGVLTPLVASFVSVTMYLILVSYQDLNMPSWVTILQLFSLTIAHAVLMTSGAIVISVQSTSVKAANLLASFIVIPVAILMQGESVLLFWGNSDVLWLAIVGVLILAFLFVRLGIVHFNREYLLGREIDTLNFRWIVRTVWSRFKGQAVSIADWYRRVLWMSVSRLAVPFALVLMMAVAGAWFAYDWTVVNVPVLLEKVPKEDMTRFVDKIQNEPDLTNLQSHFNAPSIFGHNVRAMFGILLAGLVSFSVLGVIVYLINVGLIGGVLGVLKLVGVSPLLIFAAGLLPHGIFEIPALMLGTAAMLRMGVVLVAPQLGKSMGEVIIDTLADWMKVFIGIVIPLLAIASVVETYITPVILLSVIK
jgi:uncharacterized membrane protein SpoIIM required for sporulation